MRSKIFEKKRLFSIFRLSFRFPQGTIHFLLFRELWKVHSHAQFTDFFFSFFLSFFSSSLQYSPSICRSTSRFFISQTFVSFYVFSVCATQFLFFPLLLLRIVCLTFKVSHFGRRGREKKKNNPPKFVAYRHCG